MQEKIKNIGLFNIERWLLNNLTRLSFYLILILITIQIIFFTNWKIFLNSKDLLTLIWAILVFWYWYKKYEWDKKIQNIENLSNKIYNPTFEDGLYKLELLYNLYENWLISKDIWNFIENNFWMNLEDNFNSYVEKTAFIHSENKEYYMKMINELSEKYGSLSVSNNIDYKKYILKNINEQINISHKKKIKNSLFVNVSKAIIQVLNEEIKSSK